MKPNTLFFWEFLFFDVAALGWGAWELYSLRKDRRARPAPTGSDAAREAGEDSESGEDSEAGEDSGAPADEA